MEELNNKLHTTDSTVVASMISKLIEYICEQYEIGKDSTVEIDFLKNNSMSNEKGINEIAVAGLSKLLENRILNPVKLLEELITLIPNNNTSHGLVKAISCTMNHQLERTKNEHTQFNLHLPQHPFIRLMIKDPEYLHYIYEEMIAPRELNDITLWNSLHYSFYQFCICNPDNKLNFYKMKLWKNLIQTSTDTKLITQLISWIPFDSNSSILVTAELLDDLSVLSMQGEINVDRQVLLMLQVSALYHLVSRNYNPSKTLFIIDLLIDTILQIDFANAILLILVKIIMRSSLAHVLEVLQICELLIIQPTVNIFVLESVKMSLLHWIGNPSTLTSKVVAKAGNIYLLIQDLLSTERKVDNNFSLLYKKFENLIISNREVYIACKLAMLSNAWKTKHCILNFLKHLENAGQDFIKQVVHLIYGLLVSDSNDPEVVLEAFSVICTYYNNCDEFSYIVLTLILYKISNTTNSNVQFKLLKYLPDLTKTKENYQKIVSTINVIFNGANGVLKTLAMSLMYDVWIINKKAYPYLEEMLTSAVNDSMNNLMEFYINKAYIIKKICDCSPEVHGADMVAQLSRILSKCSREGDSASAIAIDGIIVLCNANVIDIETTWTTLAPKFIEDGRTQTVESLLHLAAAIANLLHPENHVKLQEEVICKVWCYAETTEDLRIKRAAFDALLEFGLENISPFFPEKYLDKTSDLSNMNHEQIPGHSWIKFLKNQTNFEETGNFLIKMLSKEVDEFPKSVYHVASMKEPVNYSYLPTRSILRGIAEYCRIQMSKWRNCKPLYLELMRILSQEYSKPFPPCNWCYLQELLHEPELKTYCLNLASHQVVISGTARRLIENYIIGVTDHLEKANEILLIYKNLKFLANSIQPSILRPFLRNTVNYAKNISKEDHKNELLNSVIGFLKDLLVNANIQEVTKREIVEVIDGSIDNLEASDELFNIFSICVVHYPPKFLDLTMKLDSKEKMTPVIYQRAVKIGCSVAIMPNGTLKWINDLINTGITSANLAFPLEELLNVLKLKVNQSENAEWAAELFGRIEAAVADSNKKAVVLLLNVLIVSSVVFSGYYMFSDSVFDLQEYILLFPQSIASLMNIEEWTKYSLKAMECIYYLNANSKGLVSELYQNIFGQSLQALRNHNEFKKNNKWMKYLSSNVNLGNYL